MTQRRVHIVYEYSHAPHPHGSAYLRLLRPLGHPKLRQSVHLTAGIQYEGQPVDVVIVDRLWRPDLSPNLAEGLVAKIRDAGTRFIYTLDDNFLDLPAERPRWPGAKHLPTVEYFLRQADGVVVTTQPLKERLAAFNPNIFVVPNVLDERLLFNTGLAARVLRFRIGRETTRLFRRGRHALGQFFPTVPRKIVIGYMGTLTHDEDLMMVVPALQAIGARYRDRVEFHIIGVAEQSATLEALSELPVRVINLTPELSKYQNFISWFSSRIRWDIAIAPLRDTPFNRCKSDIKFLDYCTIGAAGIYSRVPAYESTVKHLETGWLAENSVAAWEEALESLLEKAILRQQLAENSLRYLYAQRILAQRVFGWAELLDDLYH